MKFFREYTRTVLSDVAVATRGNPLGFGIDTHAREFANGLSSAMGRIRRGVKDVVAISNVSMEAAEKSVW